ncbi:lysophospholipid acyltransferase family protein [Nocardia sp. NPDC057663]|uniref:lysophospholipid acyltransferase family protein n=1 Tax=Nocardia sp. NPDC057663 TaxID=3346201 RepID=UPI0036725131
MTTQPALSSRLPRRAADAPTVSFSNRDAVYEFYARHRQNRLRAKLLCAATAFRHRPQIRYADGARSQLEQLIRDGKPLIVAINHLSIEDPHVLAACSWRSILRPMIGRTRVLAKDDLFLAPAQRSRLDTMGGIPVFRGKDHGLRAAHSAGQQLIDVCVDRLQLGDNLALFPEGTCNETDPTRVQAIGTGIGHIAHRAERAGVTPALLFLGLTYGPDHATTESATFYFDTPVTELPDRPASITRSIAAGMQKALDGAIAHHSDGH